MDKYYISRDTLCYPDKKIKVKRAVLKLSELSKFKPSPDLNIIAFELSPRDLKPENGERILSFFESLKKRKINFMVARPLPACLFGIRHFVVSKFGVPVSCKECIDLFTLENEMIKYCERLDFRMGPKIDYMRDREQIYEYFRTFYDNLPKQKFCRRCLYNLRNKCYTCLRILKNPKRQND